MPEIMEHVTDYRSTSKARKVKLRSELSEANVGSANWRNWKWQQKNSVKSIKGLLSAFPGLSEEKIDSIANNLAERKLTITPYTLKLIHTDETRSVPLESDPMWRQLVPSWSKAKPTFVEYDGETENWEMPEEMITDICQHKYDNRVIIRLANVCHSYCQFCYEALRTLEKSTTKLGFKQRQWDDTVDYIRHNSAVEEVILSGGEPLMHSDAQLDKIMSDINSIDRPIIIRLHTRALTFNPYRVTDELVEVFAKHRVGSVGIHISHPNEITDDFRAAVKRLSRAVPVIFANIPLLKRINSDVETMHTLCMELYRAGVVPHYLYHFMPFSPGVSEFRTTVEEGIDLMRSLKRHISNIAVPEYVLPHYSGKYTVPLITSDEECPSWIEDKHGRPVYSYVNWRGEASHYSDTRE